MFLSLEGVYIFLPQKNRLGPYFEPILLMYYLFSPYPNKVFPLVWQIYLQFNEIEVGLYASLLM